MKIGDSFIVKATVTRSWNYQSVNVSAEVPILLDEEGDTPGKAMAKYQPLMLRRLNEIAEAQLGEISRVVPAKRPAATPERPHLEMSTYDQDREVARQVEALTIPLRQADQHYVDICPTCDSPFCICDSAERAA